MKLSSFFGLALLCAIFSFQSLAAEQTPKKIVVYLPNLSWAVEINEPGFAVQKAAIAPDGSAVMLQAENTVKSVALSVFIEKAATKGGAKECRSFYWGRLQKGTAKKEQVKQYEIDNMAINEYIIPEYDGIKINQKNVNAYLAEGDYWIDVHFSKISYEAGANDPFPSMLKNISINRTYTPSSVMLFSNGNMFFSQNEYKKALVPYEKAFEMEKKDRTFSREMWLILIDQLGMSYGISGDLIKAKQTFEWAVTTEPEYPFFYYNLACAFAEMGNTDNTLQNLRLFFKFIDNRLPGETISDPTTDQSFSECMKNQKFSTEVTKMMKDSGKAKTL